MKVVDAVWELKNIGKKTVEISLEKQDYLHAHEEICAAINNVEQEYKSEYTVVKVKAGNPWLGYQLLQKGFVLIETQVIIQALQEDVVASVNKYASFFEATSYEELGLDDVPYIKSEIEKGIFITDRIALDPRFNIQIANKRYSNWLDDEMTRGAHLYCVLVDGERIGFGLSREKGNNRYGLLAGVFTDYSKCNYGANLLYACSTEAIKKDFLFFHGAVSGNNSKILALHESFGYRTKSLQEVYIKHNDSI